MGSLWESLEFLIRDVRWSDREAFEHFKRTLWTAIPEEQRADVALALKRKTRPTVNIEGFIKR